VVFAGAHDRLSAEPADELSLAVDGPFAAGLRTEPDNLVLRAGRALAAATGTRRGARITLEKNLPIASGIGGGSSDAAAALRLLGRLWGVPVPAGLAAGLGADVPVCMAPVAQHMSGVGEVLGDAPSIPECGIVLVNPGVALSTQSVFRARSAAFSAPAVLPASWPTAAAMAADLAALGNDLEAPALALCPAIGGVLAALRALPACRLARMSGSGATCFALFDSALHAAHGAAALARPGWWCWGGSLWPGTLREG
jgi:4-diphosphocytidyl-2-C-methyl-D-erythritol kinase